MATTTVVINLFGEPGAGKSTAAAYIFAEMKMRGINCEYISEFAKENVWSERSTAFEHQPYLFGNQYDRQGNVDGKVDIIITDSPLLLSAVYNSDPRLIEHPELHQKMKDLAAGLFDTFNNYNILLQRQHEYVGIGRNETEAEARTIRKVLCETFEKYNVPYVVYPAQKEYFNEIIDQAVEISNQLKAEHVMEEFCLQTGFRPKNYEELFADALVAIQDKSSFPFKHVDENGQEICYMVQSCNKDETGKYKAKCIVNVNGEQHTIACAGTEETMISGKSLAEGILKASIEHGHKQSLNCVGKTKRKEEKEVAR